MMRNTRSSLAFIREEQDAQRRRAQHGSQHGGSQLQRSTRQPCARWHALTAQLRAHIGWGDVYAGWSERMRAGACPAGMARYCALDYRIGWTIAGYVQRIRGVR